LSPYDKSLEIGFDEFWIRYNGGVILASPSEVNKAKVELLRASKLDPTHAGLALYFQALADS
jgi:hypothetical protein